MERLAAAQAAYEQARQAIAKYSLAEAQDLLAQARNFLATVPGEAAMELGLRIRLSGTWLICDRLGLPAALEEIAGVLSDPVLQGRDDLRSLAHIQAGVLSSRAGNHEEALEQMRLALAHSKSSPLDERIRLLLNKGTIGSQAGRLSEAVEDLKQAETLAGQYPVYRFIAMHNLGFTEFLRGDLPKALRYMAQADALDTDVDRAVLHHDRARVLREAGLAQEAAELFERAGVELRRGGLAEEWATARLEHARCLVLLGQSGEAAALARDVVIESDKRGETTRALEARVVQLEALAMATETDTVAEAGNLVDQAVELAVDARAAGRGRIADQATALQLVLAARADAPLLPDRQVVDSLRRMRSSSSLSTRLLALHAQLTVATTTRARSRLLHTATQDIGAARAGMASLDLRTAMGIHLQPLMELDFQHAATSRGWAALMATERWRSALGMVPSVLPPSNNEEAALWVNLRRQHEQLRTAKGRDASDLGRAIGQSERQLREIHWTRRASEQAGQRGRLTRRQLGTTQVLSYFWSSGQLHLVHVQPGQPAVLQGLGSREKIAGLVQQGISAATAAMRVRPGPLALGVQKSLDGSMRELDRMLLPGDIGPEPLLVVPSGELKRLPWGMLPRLADHPVTVSRSVGDWVSCSVRLSTRPRVAVAAGPGLRHAARECMAVADSWADAQQIPAEPAVIKHALATCDIIHLAAHGRHRQESPLFSSLQLRGGSLFAHELEQVNIRASLVVLPACSMGQGVLRPGNEALGLTASLLAMGVQAVVAPLTDIPDDMAHDTMLELHRRLAAGQNGPAALAAASRETLARSFCWFGGNWQLEHPA
ncbi:CHAT domain-containing tetratricopeptide repeat protein [Glutamicibacter sp. MNS18]|uniref:CHAT domain-containing protein n=1 Tax=Glutamicibacter sp. MNS18 TaxID=2989817 RepID=UPI0022359145|nr:CHAT domain-containing tetratricopeptide repeat protein [Glutamicibacter sp. MNS18]MCW4464575.1 CHAT domain-containing tetratricopeptide repeat protein [Glutamicibacter sp. MNS18]